MLLSEAVLKLIFLHSDFVDPLDVYLDEAIGDFEYALAICDGVEDFNEVVKLDFEKYLPISIVFDTYEKFLNLKRDNPLALRSFADYIIEKVPDWKDYATMLIEEAKMIEYNRL